MDFDSKIKGPEAKKIVDAVVDFLAQAHADFMLQCSKVRETGAKGEYIDLMDIYNAIILSHADRPNAQYVVGSFFEKVDCLIRTQFAQLSKQAVAS